MSSRSRWFPALIFGVVGLSVGAAGGFVIGLWWSARFWTSFTLPVFAASGNQAYTVLTLLDADQVSRLRGMMEAEIDHTLDFLESRRADPGLRAGDPALKVYQRLRRYRDAHQIRSHAVPPKDTATAQGRSN